MILKMFEVAIRSPHKNHQETLVSNYLTFNRFAFPD